MFYCISALTIQTREGSDSVHSTLYCPTHVFEHGWETEVTIMLATLLWIGGMIRRQANKTESTLFLIVMTLSGLPADRSIITLSQ